MNKGEGSSQPAHRLDIHTHASLLCGFSSHCCVSLMAQSKRASFFNFVCSAQIGASELSQNLKHFRNGFFPHLMKEFFFILLHKKCVRICAQKKTSLKSVHNWYDRSFDTIKLLVNRRLWQLHIYNAFMWKHTHTQSRKRSDNNLNDDTEKKKCNEMCGIHIGIRSMGHHIVRVTVREGGSATPKEITRVSRFDVPAHIFFVENLQQNKCIN